MRVLVQIFQTKAAVATVRKAMAPAKELGVRLSGWLLVVVGAQDMYTRMASRTAKKVQTRCSRVGDSWKTRGPANSISA